MSIIRLLFISLIAFASLQAQATDSSLDKPKPADTPKKTDISIAAIELGIFDRLTGKLVGIGEGSDPYGMFNDIFVTVKIKNIKSPQADDPSFTLKLTATTPRTDDEARGIMEATKQAFSKTTMLNSDGEITTIPFLVEFECNPMTFTVEIVELHIKKTTTADIGCAE